MKTTEAELQQLRIAIATAEGWVPTPYNPPSWTQHPGGLIGPFIYELPDYTGSREVIFDACNRRFKTQEEQIRFVVEICKEIGSILNFPKATAEQLCRAYLSVVGAEKTNAMKTDDNHQLANEFARRNRLCEELVQHLRRLGAAEATVPVIQDEVYYDVTIKTVPSMVCVKCEKRKPVNDFATPDECEQCFEKVLGE